MQEIDIYNGLGIIPAYAGSTLRRAAGRRGAGGSSPHTRGAPCVGPPGVAGPGDHPRIRGEHPV